MPRPALELVLFLEERPEIHSAMATAGNVLSLLLHRGGAANLDGRRGAPTIGCSSLMSRIPVPTFIIHFIVKICRQGLLAIWTVAAWSVAFGARIVKDDMGSARRLAGCGGHECADVRQLASLGRATIVSIIKGKTYHGQKL